MVVPFNFKQLTFLLLYKVYLYLLHHQLGLWSTTSNHGHLSIYDNMLFSFYDYCIDYTAPGGGLDYVVLLYLFS